MAFRLGINFETNVATLINDMTRASRSVSASSQQMSNSLQSATNLAKGLAAVFGVGISVRGIVNAADSFANLSNRIKVVSVDAGAAQKAFDGVRRIAADTNTSIGSTAELYSRMTTATKDLGLSQRQVLDMTEAVNQTLRISGVTGSEAAASMIQLGQAMGSGRLQGDELRSILENNNRLARLLAEGMGVSVGALKDLGKEGAITSDIVANILLKSLGQLNAEAGKIAPTIGGAMGEIKDQFSAGFFNQINSDIGAMTKALDAMSVAAGQVGDALGAVVTAAVKFGPAAWNMTSNVMAMSSPIAGGIRAVNYSQDLVSNKLKAPQGLNDHFASWKKQSDELEAYKQKAAENAKVLAGGISTASAAATAGVSTTRREVDGLSRSYEGVSTRIKDVGKENARMFSDLSRQIISAGNDMEQLKSIALGFLADFASGLADLMFGQSADGSLGGNLAGQLFGLFGGGFVQSSGTAAYSSRSLGQLSSAALSGAFGPGFANGGIANRPSIFGEAGPEAAVPLPDGRRIPVDLRGGESGGTYYIDARGADAAAVERLEATIKDLNGTIERRAIAAVADKFSRSRGFMRT